MDFMWNVENGDGQLKIFYNNNKGRCDAMTVFMVPTRAGCPE